MKKNIALVILFIIYTYKAFAGDLLGMICNEYLMDTNDEGIITTSV